MPNDEAKLTAREVAVILGEPGPPLSNERIYQLDPLLRPARGPGYRGKQRLYDPAIVALVLAERRARTAR